MRTSGTTLECFSDLMVRIEPDLFEKRRLLARTLGVEDATIRRWMTGSAVPVGMSMISLRYYLEYLGYEVSELAKLPEVINQVARLLAFRVLSLEELANLTGFQGYTDQVLAVLRGARGLSEDRKSQFHGTVRAYRQELECALREVPKLAVVKQSSVPSATKVLSDSSSPKLTAAVLPVVAASFLTVKANQRREERFKSVALNLLDFAQYYANPEVPEEVRDRLRSVVGQENIFDLKNLLSRLCSSKAFSNQQ